MTSKNNNSNGPVVHTAVSISEDLERPLLVDEEEHVESQTDCCPAEESVEVTSLYQAFRTHGMIIGFLVQLLNVSGSTYMYYRWGSEGVFSKFSENILETLLHASIYAITQIDLYLYLFMWIALTAVLTQPGMAFVRQHYFEKGTASKRSVFVLGVQFYIGVVVGVFFAWTAIDCVLGLPVPVLPMLGVLVFGLCISYTMIWCYDLEDSLEEEEEFESSSLSLIANSS